MRRSAAICAKTDLLSTSSLLIALGQSGARIIEVPIDWHDVPGSKLHFLRDSGQMLAAVIKMRRRGDLTIRR